MKKILRNTLYIVLAVVLLQSCTNPTEKPFIIINKHRWVDHDSYKYIDKNGIASEWFEDDRNKYNVGDTLK